MEDTRICVRCLASSLLSHSKAKGAQMPRTKRESLRGTTPFSLSQELEAIVSTSRVVHLPSEPVHIWPRIKRLKIS